MEQIQKVSRLDHGGMGPPVPGPEPVPSPALLIPFTGRAGEAIEWSGVETPAWLCPLWFWGWNSSRAGVNKMLSKVKSEKCKQSTYWIPWKLTHNDTDPLVSSSAPLPNKMNVVVLAATCVWKTKFQQTSEQVDRWCYLDPWTSLDLLTIQLFPHLWNGHKKVLASYGFCELHKESS